MQQPFIFIYTRYGWESLNDSNKSIAVLSDFTITWGTDKIDTVPDPAVMQLTLNDRSGRLAGNIIRLAGARIICQLSAQPTWNDLTASMGSWQDTNTTLSRFYQSYLPALPDNPESRNITIFDGIISNGGTITDHHTHYLINLTATSRFVLWKRLSKAGPTSTQAKYAGYHWVGSPAERLNEMNRRASLVGAPKADATGIDLPPSVMPYDMNTYPSQFDLLHRLFSHSSHLPIWSEYPDKNQSVIKPLCYAQQVQIRLTASGTISVSTGSIQRRSIPASHIIIDQAKLTVPDPITQIVVNAHQSKADEGKLGYDEQQTTFTTQNLPASITMLQSSLTLESDAISGDTSAGLNSEKTWTPTDSDRAAWAYLLDVINTRLQPTNLIFDSRYLSPLEHQELYTTAPSGAEITDSSRYSLLTDETGKPLAIYPWTTIGGKLTFHWTNGTPILQHTTTVSTLTRSKQQPAWNDLSPLTATWDTMTSITWTLLSIINTIQ